MSDFILFCEPESFGVPIKDFPLTYRLALPAEFSNRFKFLENKIWVAVVKGKNTYIHTKLFIDYEEFLEKLETGEKYLILEGSLTESLYLTSPENLTEKKANITDIISKYLEISLFKNLPEVFVCEPALSLELENFIVQLQKVYLSIDAVPRAIVANLIKDFDYSTFTYKENNFEALLRDSFVKLKKKVPMIESFVTREISFPYGSMSLMMANEIEKHFKGERRKGNLERAVKLFSYRDEESSKKSNVEVGEDESFTPPPFEGLDPKLISYRVSPLKVSKEKKLSKIRTERAERHHQEILKILAELLKEKGLNIFYNEKIDLAVIEDDKLWIFEIKTTTPKNYVDQVRNGIIQLIESEFLYNQAYKIVLKVLVLESYPPEKSIEYIEEFLIFTKILQLYYDRSTNIFVYLDNIFN